MVPINGSTFHEDYKHPHWRGVFFLLTSNASTNQTRDLGNSRTQFRFSRSLDPITYPSRFITLLNLCLWSICWPTMCLPTSITVHCLCMCITWRLGWFTKSIVGVYVCNILHKFNPSKRDRSKMWSYHVYQETNLSLSLSLSWLNLEFM